MNLQMSLLHLFPQTWGITFVLLGEDKPILIAKKKGFIEKVAKSPEIWKEMDPFING